MDIENIITENKRRNARIHAPYNPTGDAGGTDPEIRCLHDFPFWAATYVKIKPKGGGEDIPFVLNPPQRKLVAALEKMRLDRQPIRLILLKARQWGGSTCVQLYMAWLQMVHKKGLNSLIIAHYSNAAAEIKDMFDRMLASYPRELLLEEAGDSGEEESGKRPKKPKITEKVSHSTMRLIPRNCKIKVCSAETPTASRGGDYNLVHISEVGLWKTTRLRKPQEIIRSACSGVLLEPMTMIVMESTANGTGTYFHSEYMAAKKGEGQFKPLFIPWFEIPHYSREFPSEESMAKFAEKLYRERENPHSDSARKQPGTYLWRLWEQGATLEAINWYILERAKYGDHGEMAAEYPSDDVEAFVHSGTKVFDIYKVEALRKDCMPPLEKGELNGEEPSGAGSLKKIRFIPDTQGCLSIWRHPEKSPYERIKHRYLTVVDVGGRSMKSDWSVIVVLDRCPDRAEGLPEIAAQWRGHCDMDILAWKAARIATYYDNSLLVIESNTIETNDPEARLESDHTPFIFTQLRNKYKNLYYRGRNATDIKMGTPLKYGFHTNATTKPMVISTLIQMIREGAYVERDENCLEEYLAYEQRQNGSYGALPGHHDDMLMTRAIGLHISTHEMQKPYTIIK